MDTTPPPTVPGSQSHWEEAFLRFESPEEEQEKFRKRLRRLGCDSWPRDARVVDIFCGRGQNLVVLEQLGFRNLEGVDLSANLLNRYRGPARMIEADCRDLPFPPSSRDVIVVQGGLHHLPNLGQDLPRTLDSVAATLKPGGLFVMVEPWRTPFLTFVHAISRQKAARRLWSKLDAFEILYEEEHQTYDAWLYASADILRLLDQRFESRMRDIGWGKIHFVGTPRKAS